MTDRHSPSARSKNMAAVKGKNTSPELKIRKLLHSYGYRFTLNNKHLPGNPDIVMKKHNTVVFIHGCFWHLHNCYKSTLPKTNSSFWKQKLEANKLRDQENIEKLEALGWRIVVIWECALKGKLKVSDDEVINRVSAWLKTSKPLLDIAGV